MIFLIHLLEAVLVSLIIILGFRVAKVYRTEHTQQKSASNDDTIIIDRLIEPGAHPSLDRPSGKAVVEGYIGEFFDFGEAGGNLDPLRSLQEKMEVACQVPEHNEASAERQETKEVSISGKVINAIMNDSELLCVS